MKQRITLCLLTILISVAAMAQPDGLNIKRHFGGHYANKADNREVNVVGSLLKKYKLTCFMSLELGSPDNKTAQEMEDDVLRDTKIHLEYEEGRRNGRLYYGIYRLSDKPRGNHRYIFYRNNALRQGNDRGITLIYMEGLASMTELKEQFGK